MGIYQLLKEAGFNESPKGPIVISGLDEVIEGLASSTPFVKIHFAILPGCLVPEARPKDYDLNTFQDNYIVFLRKSDK